MMGGSDLGNKAGSGAGTIYASLMASGVFDPVGVGEEKWKYSVCIKFR